MLEHFSNSKAMCLQLGSSLDGCKEALRGSRRREWLFEMEEKEQKSKNALEHIVAGGGFKATAISPVSIDPEVKTCC